VERAATGEVNGDILTEAQMRMSKRTLRPWLIPALMLTAVGPPATALALWLCPQQGFVSRVYEDADGGEYRYQVFVPHGYHPARRWPVILFLHGAGQTGTDGKAPTSVGLGPAIRRREPSFPFLVVFPQSVDRTWGVAAADGKRALAILDEVGREYSVDEDRVYLTGFSMGGGGTWSLAAAEPGRWAAIAPVCGYGHPAWAKELAGIPCWCFHGAEDRVIPVERSREMVGVMRGVAGSIRYTEYPGVGHNAWDSAYNTDELYDWLLSNTRSANPGP
jgi:predicted peptidase